MRLAVIDKMWAWLKGKRPVYTLLPQGKASHAVIPMAEYRYIPKTKRQEEEEDEEEKKEAK